MSLILRRRSRSRGPSSDRSASGRSASGKSTSGRSVAASLVSKLTTKPKRILGTVVTSRIVQEDEDRKEGRDDASLDSRFGRGLEDEIRMTHREDVVTKYDSGEKARRKGKGKRKKKKRQKQNSQPDLGTRRDRELSNAVERMEALNAQMASRQREMEMKKMVVDDLCLDAKMECLMCFAGDYNIMGDEGTMDKPTDDIFSEESSYSSSEESLRDALEDMEIFVRDDSCKRGWRGSDTEPSLFQAGLDWITGTAKESGWIKEYEWSPARQKDGLTQEHERSPVYKKEKPIDTYEDFPMEPMMSPSSPDPLLNTLRAPDHDLAPDMEQKPPARNLGAPPEETEEADKYGCVEDESLTEPTQFQSPAVPIPSQDSHTNAYSSVPTGQDVPSRVPKVMKMNKPKSSKIFSPAPVVQAKIANISTRPLAPSKSFRGEIKLSKVKTDIWSRTALPSATANAAKLNNPRPLKPPNGIPELSAKEKSVLKGQNKSGKRNLPGHFTVPEYVTKPKLSATPKPSSGARRQFPGLLSKGSKGTPKLNMTGPNNATVPRYPRPKNEIKHHSLATPLKSPKGNLRTMSERLSNKQPLVKNAGIKPKSRLPGLRPNMSMGNKSSPPGLHTTRSMGNQPALPGLRTNRSMGSTYPRQKQKTSMTVITPDQTKPRKLTRPSPYAAQPRKNNQYSSRSTHDKYDIADVF
ncbi:hypothetical protein ACHAWF_008304 [Thalassiosira exigua]